MVDFSNHLNEGTLLSFKRSNFVPDDVLEQDRPEYQEYEPPKSNDSPQQKAIYQVVQTGNGNLMIIAVAGSGKTTTLLRSCQFMSGYITIVAYNAAIAKEIAGKLVQMGINAKATTFHAYGLGAWMRGHPGCKMEGMRDGNTGYYKMDRVFDIMNGAKTLQGFNSVIEGEESTIVPYDYRGFIKKSISYAKQWAFGMPNGPAISDTVAWMNLIDRFNLEESLMDTNMEQAIKRGIFLSKKALTLSNILAEEVIDFDDMVYLPLTSSCDPFRVNWLLVDEAQDLNPCRMWLAKKMLRPGGRAVFVGDPKQAIYGFTGANSDSLSVIKQEFNCQEMPLTVSWRCAQSIVSHAHRCVKGLSIEASPTAPVGSVQEIKFKDFLVDHVEGFLERTGDAILCRKNAPLVSLAYQLIRKGIPCHMEGREIGKKLAELVNRFKVVKIEILKERLNDYRSKMMQKYIDKKDDAMAAEIDDRVETLHAVIDGLPPDQRTVPNVVKRIESMFQDTTEGVPARRVTLSSVHKAKGREWDRVYLLGHNAWMPSPYAKTDWAKEQEANLIYVAITRAKTEFFDVHIPVLRPGVGR